MRATRCSSFNVLARRARFLKLIVKFLFFCFLINYFPRKFSPIFSTQIFKNPEEIYRKLFRRIYNACIEGDSFFLKVENKKEENLSSIFIFTLISEQRKTKICVQFLFF